MKKKVILIWIVSIITILLTIGSVSAAGLNVQMIGDQTAKAGETKSVSVKIDGDQDVGVVSGKIVYSDNISNIQVSGKNDWGIKYNADNGSFNVVKASGAKSEIVLEIKYTVQSGSTGTASIKLNNLILTTTDYQNKQVSDVTKTINITEGQNNNTSKKKLTGITIKKLPKKVKYTEGEKFNKEGMTVTAKYSDGTKANVTGYTYKPNGKLKTSDKEITITYTEAGVTKTAKVEIKVSAKEVTTKQSNNATKKDKTTANKILPKTGLSSLIIIISIIVIFGIISFVKYINKRDIK